jgi:hypothetical protein
MAYGLVFQNFAANMRFLRTYHAAFGGILALISFRMPREMMLGMLEIDFGARARDSSRGD